MKKLKMKNKILLICSFFALLSCGESSVEEVIQEGDLSEIRAKKAELSAAQSELSSQISALDEAIEKLDKNTGFALVETLEVEDTLFQHYIELPGDVETDENIIIYPEYSGILLNVAVEEGQQVQKGQILARIDDGGLSSQLAQLETQAALAKTTFERQKRLWDQKIGSEIQFLEAQANYEAVQNSVQQLRAQLGKTVVRAPFSGVIDEIFTDEGQVVVPGQSQLFRLINLSDMYITAAVPESYLGEIKQGTDVLVEIGATGATFKSEIQQVGNFIDPNNRTFEIRIAVPGDREQVKPNLIATVKLNDYTSEAAIIIPESVVQKNSAGESVVYVLQKKNDSTGVVQKRILTIGLTYEDSVEVLEGLQPGDLLITNGARSVQEGEQVQLAQ